MAGERCSWSRSPTIQWSLAPATGVHEDPLLARHPAASAASAEQTISAAPWSTLTLAVISFGYGWEIIRLESSTVPISAASGNSRAHASGFREATSENRAQSAASASMWPSAGRPSAILSAWSRNG